MVVMLDRRRLFTTALAVMAYPAGVVFAQPAPFPPSMLPPLWRSGRAAPADPTPGIGQEAADGGMAAAGFGCPGAGGANGTGRFFRVMVEVGC